MLVLLVAFLLVLVATLDTRAQPSGTATYRDYGVRFVVADGVIRPEVYWSIAFDLIAPEIIVSVFAIKIGVSYSLGASIYQDVEAGDIVNGSRTDTETTTGDLVQYLISLSHGSSEVLYVVGNGINDRLQVLGEPLVSPPELVAGSLSGTSNRTINTRLTWGEVTGDENTGYTEITGYEIQYRFGDDGEWTPVSPAPSDTARTYEHVLSGGDIRQGDLRYRIRATNLITELENSPQGPWSEVASSAIASMDLNADKWVGADDLLILYYSLKFEDEFESDTDRNTSTVGPLVKTLVGGLLRSAEVTDAAVLAAWNRALLLESAWGSVTGGINASPGIDADDALILYYAAAFRDLLGDGSSGGFESMRSALLTQPSRLTSPTDVPLKAVLQSANEFLNRYR